MSLNQRYASLNKPRPDYPIYPSAGYYRKRAEVFKRPKGRRGKKPKGQRLVPRAQEPLRGSVRQAQDFLIIKAQDEARKARELALAQAQEQAEFRQLQIADIEDKRVDRERAEQARQDELQIRRDEQQQNEITQREQLRLQGELQAETTRYRAQKIDIQQQEGERRGQAEREIVGQLRKLTEDTERRQGENKEIFQQFLASQDRRGDLSVSNIQEQERTDLQTDPQGGSLAKQQSADDRRDRRGRSVSIDESVSSNLTDLEIPDEEGFGAGHRTRGEKQRKKPKRFEGGATEEELAQAGGIEGQTPKPKAQPKPEPEPEPQSGSPQQEQKKKVKQGKIVKTQGKKKEDPVVKAASAFVKQLGETTKISEEQSKKKGGDGK